MLAVIIPTLNAETCVAPLLAQTGEQRVVISDGGSTDGTLKLALAYNAVIASGNPSRGAQLARGTELAGAVNSVTAYLFLHADCRLLPGWQAVVDTALQQENTAWFFKYRPETTGLSGLWLRFIVGLRSWAWRLPYGDQGLLIPRAMYEALGGYDRDKPLFEDVDIVDRIKAQFGRDGLKPLPLGLKTDVSCHLDEGIWTRGWRNYKLLRAYRRGTPIDELLRRYG